jgi:hypothetical protein
MHPFSSRAVQRDQQCDLMHPFSSRAVQRDQQRDLKQCPGSVDLISINKTNKQPSFIDR